MLSVDGDADAAVENTVQIGWNKLRHLVPLLTNKDISFTVRGRLYVIYIRAACYGMGMCCKKEYNDWVKKCMDF